MAKYLTEFIGTFFLVLTIGLTVVGEVAMAPLAIGGALMVMVYMGGHISGAHYNPAISVAILIRGKMPAIDLVPYFVAQFTGAIVATVVVKFLLGSTFAPLPGAGVSAGQALLTEMLYTFALTLVVLNVATTRATEGNSYYGLAIGITIVAAAFAGGPISGGAFNPAVGIGTTVIHSIVGDGNLTHSWLYVIGPLAGAVAGAFVYKIQLGDSESEEAIPEPPASA